MTNTQPTVDEDRARYLELITRRSDIDTELDAIKARVAARGVGYKVEYDDGGKVTVSPNHRFNSVLAQTALGHQVVAGRLTPQQVAECWSRPEPTLVAERVKQLLPPGVYETCLKEAGKPRVTIS